MPNRFASGGGVGGVKFIAGARINPHGMARFTTHDGDEMSVLQNRELHGLMGLIAQAINEGLGVAGQINLPQTGGAEIENAGAQSVGFRAKPA
jgi:hypothetical protein